MLPERSSTTTIEIDCSFLVGFEGHGQDLFDRRARVAVLAVGVLSSGHQEATAEIANVGRDSLHLLLGEVLSIHVADDDRIIGIQLVGGGRHLLRGWSLQPEILRSSARPCR